MSVVYCVFIRSDSRATSRELLGIFDTKQAARAFAKIERDHHNKATRHNRASFPVVAFDVQTTNKALK